MMALYIPMQPSSNTPMMALSVRSWRARAEPSWTSAAEASSGGRLRTWRWSWTSFPVVSQVRRQSTAQSSVKSSLQSSEWSTPALVRLPARFSSPTRPGKSPAQFATTRMGPWCDRSPARTWWLYCQTASTTTTGALTGTSLNTAMPIRWLSMKPCPLAGSIPCARWTPQPSFSTAVRNSDSSRCWVGQHFVLAAGGRSPLATV